MRFGVNGVAMTCECACGIAAPHRAAVLQHQDVAEARIASQVAQAIAVRPQQAHHLRRRKLRPGLDVLGRVGHQLVRADGVHQVEHAGAAAGELPLDAEQGMLVGRHADAPAAPP